MPIHTFCSRLWNEFFIDTKGNVFSCCHHGPAKLGNIYIQKLQDICNNRVIRRARAKSLAGSLPCICSDAIQHSLLHSKTVIDYNQLRKIKIAFGEQCNINCLMCKRDRKSTQQLNEKKLIQNVDFSPFRRIEIQGGEPLCIESAKNFFDQMAQRGKKISFLTNGMLINDVWAKKIALHSGFVYFSLNAATKAVHEKINRGSKWETVIRNIKRVQSARNKHCTDVKIWGHMTIVRENLSEIPLFIEKAKTLKLDRIGWCYDEKIYSFITSNHHLRQKLTQDIKKTILGCCDSIIIDTHGLKTLNLAE